MEGARRRARESGLRPHTICKLELKHIQPDFKKSAIPCKISVPQEIAKGKYKGYFTFIGEESVKYLRAYLAMRGDLSADSYLFTQYGTETALERRSMSHIFHRLLMKLKRKGLIDYEQKHKSKPSELRLCNLRKYFRKYANQAGFEFVQFWMGHVVNAGEDEHYRPRDVEFHRDLYAEKAAPFLRIEQSTPTETDKIIQKQAAEIELLKKQAAENVELRKRVQKMEKQIEKMMICLIDKPPKNHDAVFSV